MARPISKVAPGWWDYTTLDSASAGRRGEADAERLAAAVARRVSKSRSTTRSKSSICAEALEYITRLAAGDAGQPGGHLRADRADGAVAAGRADRQRAWM